MTNFQSILRLCREHFLWLLGYRFSCYFSSPSGESGVHEVKLCASSFDPSNKWNAFPLSSASTSGYCVNNFLSHRVFSHMDAAQTLSLNSLIDVSVVV